MNTPAHLLVGAAAFSRTIAPGVIAAALAGAILPDLSLYVMAGVSLFVLQIPPNVVFGELYFSDAWQTVFAIDNSFVLWGALLAFAFWRDRLALIAFAGAGLLHLGFDFLLHNDDARPHFFPLSWWVFESPVSYWDSSRHAGIVAPLEAALATIAAIVLWRKVDSLHMRGLWVTLLLAELWVMRQWLLFF